MKADTDTATIPIRAASLIAADEPEFILDCYEGEALKILTDAVHTIDRGADQCIAMANYFPERAERYAATHNQACKQIIAQMVEAGLLKSCVKCLLYMPNVPPFSRRRYCDACWEAGDL